MKTLLLSLVGIVGTTSSSIVPTVMMNNHQNINKIKTVKKELTKDFTFKLDTNYPKIEASTHKYKEFAEFIQNITDFVNPIIEEGGNWNLKTLNTKFGSYESTIENDGSSIFSDFTKFFDHDPKNINYVVEIDGPYEQGKWALIQKVTALLNTGVHFEWQLPSEFGNERFTSEEIKAGITQTFTINYVTLQPEVTSFKYTLNTDYENIKAGTYDHSEAFKNFIDELKKYMVDNDAQSWEIVEVKSKLNGLEKEAKLNDEYVKNLNKALHADKIENIKQWAEVDGPYEQGKWAWFLKASFEGDGEKYLLSHLDGYSKDNRYDEETIKSGFTNTITVKYWY